MDWYYVKAGQRVGPVEVPALKELIAKGELTVDGVNSIRHLLTVPLTDILICVCLLRVLMIRVWDFDFM